MRESNSTSYALAKSLIQTLPYGINGLFNPYRDYCSQDSPNNGPDAKIDRLANHLNCEPEFIVCGEAGGYLGCRHSGIAFTSERLLLDGSIPRITPPQERLTLRKLPFSEPSATIVWKTLYQLGMTERTILWNAVQLHPHIKDMPDTNRTPTPDEVALGKPALRLLIEVFPKAKIIAVGKKSDGLLRDMGIIPVAAVRHPANGGATLFASGMRGVVQC